MDIVQVYKDILSIPAYQLEADSLNPIFDGRLDPYPYSLQNSKAAEKAEISLETVILENKYLRLTILPQLGGRLYSAFDKTAGKEMFYRNPDLKPRMIGTRGAWFSGGIEFNFPISHSPTTMDRVNLALRSYPDGSGSVVFGNIEQISHMNWKVELRLYPGKASIEQHVTLYNPTPTENRFYFWTNAAVPCGNNLELIYPFDWCINMIEADYIKWPYYKDINCSRADKIPFSYETFGKLMTGNGFGIYNHDTGDGVVHYADRKALKGAKYFTWGTDANAAAWNRALADDGSSYIEIQSGLFETQMVYRFLRPHQTLEWSEYWYPIHETGGFKHVEKELALNYIADENDLELIFSAVETFKDCEIVLKVRDRVHVKRADFYPHRLEKVRFGLDEPLEENEGFLLDVYAGGRHILNFGQRQELNFEKPDFDLYEDSRVAADRDDKDKLFKWAVFKESVGQQETALKMYLTNLENRPDCPLTLNRIGSIYLKKLLADEAADYFRKVLRYDNRNSEARFLLAVTEKEKGNISVARRLLMDIPFDKEYFNASVIELAKADIALGYYKEAVELMDSFKGLMNGFTAFIMCCSLRKDGNRRRAETVLSDFPCDDEFIYAERYLLFGTEECRKSLETYTHCDEKVIVDIALQYIDLNLYDDAKTILEVIRKPGITALLAEFCTFCRDASQQEKILNLIQNSSPDYVFIKEKRLVRVLEEIKEDRKGIIDYLLGNFYYSAGRREEALKRFLLSYRKGFRYTVLLRNLGYILYNSSEDYDKAVEFMEEDLLLNQPPNEDSILLLDGIYKKSGCLDSRKNLIPHMLAARNRSLILVPLVEIYRDMGMLEKALEILETEEFENWECYESSGPCYRWVIFSLALKACENGNIHMAKEWMGRVDRYPANLNYGDSIRTALADVFFYRGMVHALAGEREEALEQYEKGAYELVDPMIMVNDRTREFSLKCRDEKRKLQGA